MARPITKDTKKQRKISLYMDEQLYKKLKLAVTVEDTTITEKVITLIEDNVKEYTVSDSNDKKDNVIMRK